MAPFDFFNYTWSDGDRLDYLAGTGVEGFESYGKFTGDAYV